MKYFHYILIAFAILVSCEDETDTGDDGNPVEEESMHVYFAQTHVQQPDDDLFKLISNRATLVKVQLTSPDETDAPEVKVILTLDGNAAEIPLTGPAKLPLSFNSLPGEVTHSYDDSFTGVIPKEWVKPGLSVDIQVGTEVFNYDNLKIGAPNKVIMTMFDVHYFMLTPGDYPEGWKQELECKWPASEIELRRTNDIVFSELTIPPRGEFIAARVSSKQEYFQLTGGNFDGEQAAALKWIDALKAAAGKAGRWSLYYLNIYGVSAGGQAGGFRGVGYGESIGIMNHELGHAFSLPHWGGKSNYPYKGPMYGIPAPDVFGSVHVGPTWAFDQNKEKFIPPTVQSDAVGGVYGTYKKSPMQGGGQGDQEKGFLMRHFSDYSVSKMQKYMEDHIVVWNPEMESYTSWSNQDQAYTKYVQNDGILFPVERDVEVYSVMAGVSAVTPQATILYPPIGPYPSGVIDLFDPRVEADRTRADNIYCPGGGCDVSLKILQGGVERMVMMPIEMEPTADPLKSNSFVSKAVNLKASDGEITSVEMLYTPDVEKRGLPVSPEVLYTWTK